MYHSDCGDWVGMVDVITEYECSDILVLWWVLMSIILIRRDVSGRYLYQLWVQGRSDYGRVRIRIIIIIIIIISIIIKFINLIIYTV